MIKILLIMFSGTTPQNDELNVFFNSNIMGMIYFSMFSERHKTNSNIKKTPKRFMNDL